MKNSPKTPPKPVPKSAPSVPPPPPPPKKPQSKSPTTETSPYAVQKFEGLRLEPSSKELVEFCGSDEPEAITKEEEWITKRKTELTTTKQIETRVKRQVVLEDGRVVDDSGPIVTTNTTEDTDKKESESTERRDLGNPEDNPDQVDGKQSIEYRNKTNQVPTVKVSGKQLQLNNNNNVIGTDDDDLVLAPRSSDGLVRETNDKRIVSREEIKERLETEDIRHLGDFSDEAYVKAVNSGVENLETVLYSPEHQKQLVPLGPQIVHQSTKAHKTVDTEDIEKKCLAKPDGTLVTEKKKTTEHEELFDEDLPDEEDNSTGSREKNIKTESSQRYYKQRDEQNVEYVADGKVIAKEMRYAAETEQMERDGPAEGQNDWDSLSDRIRKTRRTQKTLLQQQKEAALLADRKDALTKRPLDFDREEETRKGETMKWLESHFGSESTASSESRDGDHDVDTIEPTKKTYFNVTIKSNANGNGIGHSNHHIISPKTTNGIHSSNIKAIPNGKGINGNLSSPSKVILPDRETPKTKYFQGISNWSDRKESTPKHFASKAFRDELQGTLEKNRLRHISSREDLRYTPKTIKADDTYVRREDILQQKRQQYGSKSDLRHRKNSRDDSDDSKNIRVQKEDLGYLSGSRTDVRYRRDSNDEHERNMKNRAKTNGYLKREDSGYVKDSREDIRSSYPRDIEEDRNEKYKNSLIQRDDSAYVSSSTYFTETRLPKTPLRTPDSGVRSPSPEPYDPDTTTTTTSATEGPPSRPTVPQRKRAIEKKLRQQNSYSPPSPITYRKQQQQLEPPPDYSPPPRSRSISPAIHHNHPSVIVPNMNGIPNGIRKTNQRTRFASESSSLNRQMRSSSPQPTLRPAVSTQTIQTQTTPYPKQTTKVGTAIGNSIRKLVGKIRSASAERKLKMKSKSKSRERSPSPSQNNGKQVTPPPPGINGSTYQQYNVIDSHIGAHNGISHINNNTTNTATHTQQPRSLINRESSVVSSSTATGQRESRDRIPISLERDRRGSSDLDMLGSPKQRYYLGEDPYGGSIFGKENKYADGSLALRNNARTRRSATNDDQPHRETYVQKNISSSTLGRYQKSNQRLLGSTPNLDHDYRSAQTLPRKLDYHNRPAHHSSTINVSIVNQVKPSNHITGPAKPARTYKSLNRSKSFNVHGMNGTNDPSPIYIEKLTRNNYTNNNNSSLYKSNPHLHETGTQLKSPSIVNLISRSQRDLTRLDDSQERKYPNYLIDRRYSSNLHSNNTDKKTTFLRGLQDQAPELYRTLHGDEEQRHHKYSNVLNNREPSSLGSRSPIEINKDTASIIRRGSSSTEDYQEHYKIISNDPKRPSVTNTVQNFAKKTLPSKDGRGYQTVQSSERKSVTTSRYRGEPMSNLKYIEEQKRRGIGGGTTIIEVRGNSRK